MPGLKTIIALSFVLAVGFLLVILSCALFKVYLPLLVVATYVLAPLPNWVCSRCANPDDFVENTGNAVLDLGRFATGFLVVMGIGEYSPLLRGLVSPGVHASASVTLSPHPFPRSSCPAREYVWCTAARAERRSSVDIDHRGVFGSACG